MARAASAARGHLIVRLPRAFGARNAFGGSGTATTDIFMPRGGAKRAMSDSLENNERGQRLEFRIQSTATTDIFMRRGGAKRAVSDSSEKYRTRGDVIQYPRDVQPLKKRSGGFSD